MNTYEYNLQCWISCDHNIFWWKSWYIFFYRIRWWIASSKEQHLFKIEIFCSIINVFTVTFDKLHAFLLRKSINLFKKNTHTILLPPNFWTVLYIAGKQITISSKTNTHIYQLKTYPCLQLLIIQAKTAAAYQWLFLRNGSYLVVFYFVISLEQRATHRAMWWENNTAPLTRGKHNA